MAELMKFTEHLIGDGFYYAFGIAAVDLTGNGYLDIVAADTNVGLYWYENDGPGAAPGNFTRHVVHLREGEWLERLTIVDLNRDGRPEIVTVDNIGGSLLWFEFDGDPRKAASWKYHYIVKGELPGAYETVVADFDGDGNLDVAASSWRKGNRFSWYEQRGGAWITHVIEDNLAETRTMNVVDFNGDGKPDLLGTASGANQVIWYENPGDPVHKPWRKHIIGEIHRPIHGHAVDMDGDGDLDIIMAAGAGDYSKPPDESFGQVVWYERVDGAPEETWQKHIIAERYPLAGEAVAGDLDGDGQMEVVATAEGPNRRLALFKHHGDPRGPWSMQLLKENWPKADTVFLVDLDGDGRLDIVAAAERGSNEVRWWQNGESMQA